MCNETPVYLEMIIVDRYGKDIVLYNPLEVSNGLTEPVT